MDDKNEQDNTVSFRQESVDSVFSQGRKPFYVKSPANLSKYTFAFMCFMVFAGTSLYFVKLPIHIEATGEILAGKDYHQVVINEDNQVVSTLAVAEGEQVIQGQVLLQLDKRDKMATWAELDDINVQINALTNNITALQKYHLQSVENITAQRKEQSDLVLQLKGELEVEKTTLTRYAQNVKKGLSSAMLEDTQKRVVSQAQGNLIKEKAVFTSIDLSLLEADNNIKLQVDANNAQITRLLSQKEHVSKGLQVLSPCNCHVDNVFLEEGLPVVPGQSILTLSTSRQTSSIILYIPASEYREVASGTQIQVNVSSYPSNKYGSLKATVLSVSASPVPGSMIRRKGQGLQDATYFVIKAVIDTVPSNVTLITGMAIQSDIVIDNTSLFNLMFDLDTKR